MQSRVIKGSRAKTLLYLGFCLGFVLLGLTAQPTRPMLRALIPIGTVFFGVGACLMINLMLRPMRLLLDSQGFTVSGGVIRNRQKVCWASVDRFVLVRSRRDTTYIGYAAKQRHGDNQAVDVGIGGVWEHSTAQMVDELNRYRAEALIGPSIPARGFGRRGPALQRTA